MASASRMRMIRLAVSIAVMGAAAGCTVHKANDSGLSPTKAAGTLRAAILDSWFPATGAQWTTAASYLGLTTVLLQRQLARCVAAYGHRLPIEPVSVATETAIGNNDQFPDLNWMLRNQLFLPNAGVLSSGAPIGPAIKKILLQCEEVFPESLTLSLQGNPRLDRIWYDIYTRIQRSRHVEVALSGFSRCIVHYGVPDKNAMDFERFFAWETGVQSHAPLSALREIQHHWVRIFVRCASGAVGEQEHLQLIARAIFLREHRNRIREALAVALKVVSELERS